MKFFPPEDGSAKPVEGSSQARRRRAPRLPQLRQEPAEPPAELEAGPEAPEDEPDDVPAEPEPAQVAPVETPASAPAPQPAQASAPRKRRPPVGVFGFLELGRRR